MTDPTLPRSAKRESDPVPIPTNAETGTPLGRIWVKMLPNYDQEQKRAEQHAGAESGAPANRPNSAVCVQSRSGVQSRTTIWWQRTGLVEPATR